LLEKKTPPSKEMEGIYIPLGLVGGLAVLGAVLQTMKPGFFSEKIDFNFQAITICLIGILFSFLLLMWFLKLRVREGFEDLGFVTKWKDLVETYKVKEVCDLYNEIYDKTLALEKGAPPDQKTDAQARESVDAKFAQVMKEKPFSCGTVEEINKATAVDSFYTGIVKVSPRFLVQVHDTASACRTLLIQAYLKIKESEERKEEGFVNKPVCDTETAQRKREAQAEQDCVLPEQIPTEQKEKVIQTKLQQFEEVWKPYNENLLPENTLARILEDCKYYKNEIEKKGKEAKEMSDKYELR
jgi:hypothetical protein